MIRRSTNRNNSLLKPQSITCFKEILHKAPVSIFFFVEVYILLFNQTT